MRPEVSVACSPGFPFAGAFQQTCTFASGLPVYLLDSPDPHVIEYSEQDALWHIKQPSTSQVLAISCAVSPGFPVPILWTLLDTSLPFVSTRSFPIAVSGASQSDINGTYFPHTSTTSAATCARQLRSGASLEFSAAANHWVLSHPTDGPCYFFRPNSPRSNETVTFQDHNSDAAQSLLHLPASDESNVCKTFPNFDDGEWKVFPHCTSLPSLDDTPKCRPLEIGTRPIASSAHFNWKKLDIIISLRTCSLLLQAPAQTLPCLKVIISLQT